MSNPFGAWPRVATVALVGEVIVVGIGWVAGPFRSATSPDAAFGEVEREVQARFAQLTTTLADSTARVASHPEVNRRLGDPAGTLTSLFDLAASIDSGVLDLTIYDAGGAPRAWTDHPSELPRERILGDRGLFVTAGRTGLRPVHLEPIRATGDGAQPA